MSDKFTEITTAHGGIGEWDHVEAPEAIERCRVHYERQREEAEKVLAAIDRGEVEVYHQRGPVACAERRRVWPS